MSTQPTATTHVITGVGRLSFAYLLEPDQKGTYRAQILFPKTDKETLKKCITAREMAVAEGISQGLKGWKKEWADKEKRPATKFNNPIRDGDELFREDPEKYKEYKGCFYISAVDKKKQPGIIDARKKKLDTEEEVYSGMFAMLSVKFYPYSNESVGVGVALNNVMKIRDGERLGGGKKSAEEDFSDIDVSDFVAGDDEDDDLGF